MKKQPPAKPLLLHPACHVLLILLVGTLAYANIFEVPFIFDGINAIKNNPLIHDLRHFAFGGEGYAFVPLRWVGYLSFALNYHVGGLEVWGYHLADLLIHLANALLVYLLVMLTCRTPQLATAGLSRRETATIAVLAALFFVAHPIQTQAVTYIIQRLTSLATFFYLSGLVFYVAARLELEKKGAAQQSGPPRPGQKRLGLLLGAGVIAALLGMQTKEIAFTLPLAALLYEWSFFRGKWRQRLLYLLPLLLTLAIIPLGILSEATDNMGANGGVMQTLGDQLRAKSTVPRLDYLATQCRVLVTYLRLLVLPVNQNLDYDYPLLTSFLNPQVLGSILLLSLILALAWILHRYSRPGSENENGSPPMLRLVSFGIFWFFLTISVESSLIPIQDLIFEHRLYLPSVGAAIAVAVLVILASRKTARLSAGLVPLLLAVLLVLGLAVATWQRNQVWQSEISIWQDTANKSPNKARPWYNLGCKFDDAGRMQEAIEALNHSLVNDPTRAEAWHNLGRAYLMSGNLGQALPILRKAILLKPEMDKAAANLGLALISTGQPHEAVLLLEPRLPRATRIPEIHFALGVAYALTGDRDGARRELVALNPLDPQMAALLQEELSRLW